MRLWRLMARYLLLANAVLRICFFVANKSRNLLVCAVILAALVYLCFGAILAIVWTIVSLLYIIYTFCDHLLYNPNDPPDSRSNVLSPLVFNLPFESVYITTEDNIKINALLIKRPDSEYRLCPTLLYFHGNAGNIGHRLQNVYELYHEIGCNVLLVEYRGYGLSEGRPSEKGLYLDASAALDYLIRRPDIDSNQILVFGRSLGGAVAVELAARQRNTSKIAAVIIENTFTSIPDIGRQLFNIRLVRYLPNWYYKNQFNSVVKVSSLTAPALFISGLRDELIPSSMMTLLYSLCSSPTKQLHRLEAGTHNFTWKCHNYYHLIRHFLAQVVPSVADRKQSLHSSAHSHGSQLVANQSLIQFDDIERQTNKSFDI